ncbi:MAG: iron ABC transporter permease [Methanoregula sp.]|jgi:iron complex transport system permease protein|nr:iron ABC transporter permease [Methanoregula sp.]
MAEKPQLNAAMQVTVHSLYHTGRLKKIALLFGLTVILIAAIVYAACSGSVPISLHDTFVVTAQGLQDVISYVFPPLTSLFPISILSPDNPQAALIVLGFRFPRILLAVLTGLSLAVAGTVMQGLLRNPLVSPFTLGLSSAASFGAAVAIVIGPAILGGIFASTGDNVFIIVMAFLFGWLSMLLVYGISRSRGTSQSMLILAGVVIGYIFQAGVLGMKYISSNDRLRDLVVWLMGGMWGASWNAVLILAPLCLGCFILLELMAWDLNMLASGDDVAKSMGINVKRLRLTGLMISTFAASCCLAFTGIIGFIGLMAPHICRMLIGNDHRYLIPCSALLGASVLLISDTVARTIASPVEIPVGIIMYLIGGFFFLFLILRGRGRGLY